MVIYAQTSLIFHHNQQTFIFVRVKNCKKKQKTKKKKTVRVFLIYFMRTEAHDHQKFFQFFHLTQD